jgi:hypothetical protein
MMVLLGQTPVDPAELAKAQTALESYYSRIKTLHVTYSQQLTPAPAYRSDPSWDPALSDDHDLLYAYPSLRMKEVERRKNNDGKVVEHEMEARIHKGKRYSIDYTSKQFHTIYSSDPNAFPSLPLDPLGLRVLGSLNMPLSDLLKFPDITSVEGADEIDGEEVLVLKVGPGIPASVRPWNSEDATMTVWLAPARHYLPLRTEIRRKWKGNPDGVVRLSASSFRPVQDMARGNRLLFPHAMQIDWASGASERMTVHSAVINPTVSEQDFVMTAPPEGFFVAVDYKTQTLRGGEKQRQETVQASVAEAKRLLGSVDPPRASPSGWLSWPLGIAVVSISGLALVLVYRWRNGR